MASKLVVDAVNARLLANWTHCTIVPPNQQASAPDNNTDGSPAAFLSVQYPIPREDHITLGQPGQRLFRESGSIRFVLSIPRGVGLDTGGLWVEDLRNLFRAAQFGGITCEAASPAGTDGSNADGGYFLMRVIVPYWVDILA